MQSNPKFVPDVRARKQAANPESPTHYFKLLLGAAVETRGDFFAKKLLAPIRA
jgi:hypothetical protein